MKKRVTNDIKIQWTILNSGEAEDFTLATNIKVWAVLPNSKHFEVPFERALNVFQVRIPANMLKIGTYDLLLTYNKPDATIQGGIGTYSIDNYRAFTIVSHTEQEDDEGSEITGEINYGVNGVTFTPTVTTTDEGVVLSWSNDGLLPNPETVNLGTEFRYSGTVIQWKPVEGETWYNLFDTSGIIAQGNYAEEQGDYALEKATLADQKATLANDAASNADAKAGLANDAAALANEKAGYADESVDANVFFVENEQVIRQDSNLTFPADYFEFTDSEKEELGVVTYTEFEDVGN